MFTPKAAPETEEETTPSFFDQEAEKPQTPQIKIDPETPAEPEQKGEDTTPQIKMAPEPEVEATIPQIKMEPEHQPVPKPIAVSMDKGVEKDPDGLYAEIPTKSLETFAQTRGSASVTPHGVTIHLDVKNILEHFGEEFLTPELHVVLRENFETRFTKAQILEIQKGQRASKQSGTEFKISGATSVVDYDKFKIYVPELPVKYNLHIEEQEINVEGMTFYSGVKEEFRHLSKGRAAVFPIKGVEQILEDIQKFTPIEQMKMFSAILTELPEDSPSLAFALTAVKGALSLAINVEPLELKTAVTEVIERCSTQKE